MTDLYPLPKDPTMHQLTGDLGKRLREDFFVYKDGVMVDPVDGWILPTNYLKFANFLRHFQFRSSDIIVSTFPKSGTIWIQEILWNLLYNPDLTNPDAHESIDIRSPSLHIDMLLATSGVPPFDDQSKLVKRFRMLFPGKEQTEGIFLHLTAMNPSPRLLKTHLPLCFLPSNITDICKVVYVAREPRDVIISLYSFMRGNKLYDYKGTYEQFVDYFLDDKVCFGPYWKHMKLAWEKRGHPDFLFIFYEDLVRDLEREVRKIDAFLGTKRSERQIKNVTNYTSFESLKARYDSQSPPSNSFFANQKDVILHGDAVNRWKENLTSKQIERAHQWITKNSLKFGHDFPYYHPRTEINKNE